MMASSVTSPCPLHIMSSPAQEVRSSRLAARIVQARASRTGKVMCVGGEKSDSGSGHSNPPKLEPFSQSRLSRAMRERNLLQKAEDALSERCTVLEGEAAFDCWEALFEYENIKKEAETECKIAEPGDRDDACRPLERLENMVRQSGGVNSLIDNVRMVARIKESKKQKAQKSEDELPKTVLESVKEEEQERHFEFLEEGSIPKTSKEIQEEMDARMPESPFTRVLKRRGQHASDGRS